MKALGCVVLVAVVAVGGFLGLTGWLITRGDDQSALTRRVPLVVSHVRDVGTGSTSGYRFDYAYQQDGRWYAGDHFVSDRAWSPGQETTACIDPGHPRRHVVTVDRQPCGQESIAGNDVQGAVPTTAPRDHD